MARKILIVDDSRTMRMQVGMPLRDAGYETEEAADGLAGLAAIRALGPDVAMVLCDVNMPNMDGLQMLEALRQEPAIAGVPVVMLTTEGRAELIKRARAAGARTWLVKPFKPATLLSVVDRIIGPAPPR